ncbi:MAG: TonB-dependent receptor [Candidatus Omnitrophota bacterium]|jgi:iron complex outermembrane receptor protein
MFQSRLVTKFLVVPAVVFGFFVSSYAEDVDLEKIVVTPYRYGESLGDVPASVSVINSDQIAESNASTTVELLSDLSGVVVRDWTGNGSKATVDIRGFGEQAGLNVLVLVNGRRVNEIDLSGVSWTQIPMDQIERIEVLKGGFGSVLYGDNAVSGVINIITKRGSDRLISLELTGEYGSYAMNKEGINLGGTKDKLNYFFSYSNNATNGYRNNSYFKGTNFSTNLDYLFEPTSTNLRFTQGYSKSEYGLPGVLSSADLAKFNRRYSAYGDDHAKDTDYNFGVGFDQPTGDFGKFSFDTSLRKRQTFSDLTGANGGYGSPISKSHIDTLGFNPKYVLDKSVFSLNNKAVLGMDFYRNDFNSDAFNVSMVKQNDNYVRKISQALYFQDELALTQKFTLIGGYRYEDIKYDFNYSDYAYSSFVDSKVSLTATAYNVGLTYKYDQGNIYINHNKGFRSPAVDEYVVWGVFNPNLKQQESKNYEIGLHHKVCEFLNVGISGYLMNIRNELYYNPSGSNENYDKTRHQGIEFDLSSKLPWRFKLNGNYTFDHAVFKEGDYKGKDIPMVPEHKFNLGLTHFFTDFLSGGLSFNYMSSRRFINDEANNFSSLKQSFTVDAKLVFEKNDYKISGGINNMFNEKYYDYGVCGAPFSSNVNYYPAIGRNFFLKVSKKF